jgi:hypothetical protein
VSVTGGLLALFVRTTICREEAEGIEDLAQALRRQTRGKNKEKADGEKHLLLFVVGQDN